MRLLLSVIFVLVPSFASKERVPLQNLPEDEKNILFELVKRLGKSSEYDGGWRDNAQSLNPSLRCAVSTNMSSIIKRIDSENNGAKFLTLHEDIETNEACSDLCCKNKSCDLAVYENKGDHHCYLFQCEGKCLFGHHSSYISNIIVRRAQQPPAGAADGSELDLMNLDEDSNTVHSSKDNSVNPTTTPVPTTTAPTSAPYIRAHSVGLEGPHCERDLHCEDPNAVCNYHKCRCQEGYYQKGHICRKNCAPSSFGCLELGTLGRGPQCVSVSQVCDSVMQCADGSDEFNCPDTADSPYKTPGVANKNGKLTEQGDDSRRLGGNAEGKPDTPSKADSKAPEHEGDSSSSKDQDKSSAQEALPSSQTEDGSDNDNNNDDNNKKKPASDDTKESQQKTAEKEDSPKTTPAGKTNGFPPSKEDSDLAKGNGLQGQSAFGKGSEKEDLIQKQNAFISKVKLNLPKETANMQGPIIALSLGLAFTVILLVFVACRLRTVRRRLRKGRPLHSNEADYLINGMYL